MTVTTFSFTYSGGIEDWVVPFHTGTIRLDVVGGYGGREQGAPGGAGGNPGTISGTATIAAGTVSTLDPEGNLVGEPEPVQFEPVAPDPLTALQAQVAELTAALSRSAAGFIPNSHIAFAGVYAGDVTADGGWAAFCAWVGAHYGLTLA